MSYQCMYLVPRELFENATDKNRPIEVNNIINNNQPNQSKDQLNVSKIKSRPSQSYQTSNPPKNDKPTITPSRSFSSLPTSSNYINSTAHQSTTAEKTHPTNNKNDVNNINSEELMDIDEEMSDAVSIKSQKPTEEMEIDDSNKSTIEDNLKKNKNKKKQNKQKNDTKDDLIAQMNKIEDEELEDVVENRLNTLLGKKKENTIHNSKNRKEKFRTLQRKMLHEIRKTSPYYPSNSDFSKKRNHNDENDIYPLSKKLKMQGEKRLAEDELSQQNSKKFKSNKEDEKEIPLRKKREKRKILNDYDEESPSIKKKKKNQGEKRKYGEYDYKNKKFKMKTFADSDEEQDFIKNNIILTSNKEEAYPLPRVGKIIKRKRKQPPVEKDEDEELTKIPYKSKLVSSTQIPEDYYNDDESSNT